MLSFTMLCFAVLRRVVRRSLLTGTPAPMTQSLAWQAASLEQQPSQMQAAKTARSWKQPLQHSCRCAQFAEHVQTFACVVSTIVRPAGDCMCTHSA